MLRFNGATDANHAYTPDGHRSHDLGMAMDLGVIDWISSANQLRQGEQNIPAISIPALPAGQPKWSVERAIELSGLLNAANSAPPGKEPAANNQQAMTRDFLSLYWATKEDIKAGNQWLITGGSTDAERLKIQTALFRAGNAQRKPDASKSLINNVFIGASTTTRDGKVVDANRYPQVNEVLNALGVSSSATVPHEHHFHLTFAPPGIQKNEPSGPSSNLLAEFNTDLLAQELPEEEAKPLQDTLIALSLPKADKVVKNCRTYVASWEAPNTNTIDPRWDAQKTMGGQQREKQGESVNQWVDRLNRDWAIKRVSLVEPPLQGRYVEGDSGINPNGVHLYRYVAPSTEFNGQDRWSFLVEFTSGKRTSVRYQMNPGEPADNSRPQYCKTNLLSYQLDAAPEGDISAWNIYSWQAQSQLSAVLASASSVQPILADLPGAAPGLHEGSDWNVSITLDTNAAGHGGYVDATPWSVSDDYLPTSDPNLWLAKPGSGTEGKMDMLIVRLHELRRTSRASPRTGIEGQVPCKSALSRIYEQSNASV